MTISSAPAFSVATFRFAPRLMISVVRLVQTSGEPPLCHHGRVGAVAFAASPELADSAWDQFLAGTAMGQFQQSSLWAQYKSSEGWSCHRVVARSQDEILGGFQLLWRPARFGRIGYLSKGPVVANETEELLAPLLERLVSDARRLKLVALVAQPPDQSRIGSAALARAGFVKSNPLAVVETTLLVSTCEGKEAAERRMNRNTRRNIKAALKGGVQIREAGVADAAVFFELMRATCERQQAAPNPASAQRMEHLFRVLGAGKALKVLFAEHEGRVLAGVLNIPFGKRVNVWKKGWNCTAGELHPNDLLYHSTIAWAADHRFDCCDFAAFDHGIALALARGTPLTEEQLKTWHMFNYRFGGTPVFLPPAQIWLGTGLLRLLYKRVLALTGLPRFLGGLVR